MNVEAKRTDRITEQEWERKEKEMGRKEGKEKERYFAV